MHISEDYLDKLLLSFKVWEFTEETQVDIHRQLARTQKEAEVLSRIPASCLIWMLCCDKLSITYFVTGGYQPLASSISAPMHIHPILPIISFSPAPIVSYLASNPCYYTTQNGFMNPSYRYIDTTVKRKVTLHVNASKPSKRLTGL